MTLPRHASGFPGRMPPPLPRARGALLYCRRQGLLCPAAPGATMPLLLLLEAPALASAYIWAGTEGGWVRSIALSALSAPPPAPAATLRPLPRPHVRLRRGSSKRQLNAAIPDHPQVSMGGGAGCSLGRWRPSPRPPRPCSLLRNFVPMSQARRTPAWWCRPQPSRGAAPSPTPVAQAAPAAAAELLSADRNGARPAPPRLPRRRFGCGQRRHRQEAAAQRGKRGLAWGI